MSRADDFRQAADETLVQPGQGDPATAERRPKHRAGDDDVLGGGDPAKAPGPREPADLDDEFAGAPADGPEGSDGQDDGSID